jgi:hypothetical protein
MLRGEHFHPPDVGFPSSDGEESRRLGTLHLERGGNGKKHRKIAVPSVPYLFDRQQDSMYDRISKDGRRYLNVYGTTDDNILVINRTPYPNTTDDLLLC